VLEPSATPRHRSCGCGPPDIGRGPVLSRDRARFGQVEPDPAEQAIGATGCGAPNAGTRNLIWSLRERAALALWLGIVLAINRQCEYAAGSCQRGNAVRTPKTINRILRSQQPVSTADEPVTSWRCQFCGRRFTDRKELLEHLEAEQRRQEERIVL
jgi:hypothetical protein